MSSLSFLKLGFSFISYGHSYLAPAHSLGTFNLIARSICYFRTRYKSKRLLANWHLDGFESLTDREFASGRVASVSVNAHGLRHLQLLQVSPGSLSEFLKLRLHLESLKLFLGGLHTLMERCLLLLLVLLLSLSAIAVLSPLAQLLAWALLLLLVLLSVATLSLDETSLETSSGSSDTSRSLIEAGNLMKKDMSLFNSNFGAFR